MSPLIVLVKIPKSEPSEVLLSLIDGISLVELQQNPLAVIVAPPSETTSPTIVIEVDVMLVTSEILRVGISFTGSFLHDTTKSV